MPEVTMPTASATAPAATAPPDVRPDVAPMPNLGAPAPEPEAPPQETLGQGFARGARGEQYVVDAQGNMTPARTTAPSGKGTFGRILAGMVFGALAGATAETPPTRSGAAGDVGSEFGAGAGAARQVLGQQDVTNRARAQQDFQNRTTATEAQNRDLRYKAELHVSNLQAIKLAHDIDEAAKTDPLVHRQLVNAVTASELALSNEAAKLGLVNERTYGDYASIPQADIDKFNRHEVKITTLPDGTVKAWDRTFDARVTPNIEDFELRNLVGLDPKTGKAEWKTVGHVAAGKGTVAQHEAEIDKERGQLLDAAGKNALIEKEKAQTEKERAGAAKDWSVAEMNRLMVPGGGGNEADANVLLDAAYNLQVDPVKVTSLRTNARQAFFQRLLTRHPDFNQGAWTIAMDAKKAYTGGGKIGQNLGNFSTAIEHLDQMSRVYDAMQGGDIKLMNRFARDMGYQTGATPVAQWNILVNALSDELERAYTGVGATQEGARMMREGFAKDLSRGQAKAAISTTMQTLKSRENSLRSNFVNAMPSWFKPEQRQPEAQGINLISPQAKEIFDRWGVGDRQVAAPPTGATHVGTDAQGRDHYLDAQGKDLGLVPGGK